ncbi:MAG: ARMT1-like domain-containing protein, partial [Candidatus Desulfatibia sp.]|uniref:ARMT1-like domain-containing protein n=1 Tax=Candidatus Desulfatibia sp. TaxID=3101189 RepID=UPI002F32D5D6
PGENPETDAWFTTFYIENHLDYFTHPDQAATPEQIRFMVYTEEDERYYPCSDRMFAAIMSRGRSDFIREKYNEVLQRIMELINRQIEDQNEKKYLKSLIKIKFKHETRDEIMIPSRLEKRLMRIFLNHTHIEDPYLFEKARRNRQVGTALNSEAFQKALNHVDSSQLVKAPTTLTAIKEHIEHLEFKRLISLSVENSLWESDKSSSYTKEDYLKLFNRPLSGNGVDSLFQFLGIQSKAGAPQTVRSKKILWLTNEAGEVMVDLSIIHYLVKLGHKIIIAFKEGALFTKVDFADAQEDETLFKKLESALFIQENNMTKNELLKMLRSEYYIFAISDGTRENLNLLLTSTAFARIFKEVDGVISRGHQQKRRFFDTHFHFTQDIFNISEDDQGSISICYKPKHPSVIKFSHKDLESKAQTIIDHMETAKKKGMTVVFYSGIIGSIPGKIGIAKKIMSVFVEFLKKQSAMTFIINPSEYFEPGMDADDLMYMWEIVQRSGLIDIWRFQTYDDIAQAFQIMNKKVPPEWVGKDATFSTGCTKEMRSALDVQMKHPEMQIIGPATEKFMRRDEYGIGKMYDKRLS